jgi:hypothetical protein
MFNSFKLFLAHGADCSYAMIEQFEQNDIAQYVQSIQTTSYTWCYAIIEQFELDDIAHCVQSIQTISCTQ